MKDAGNKLKDYMIFGHFRLKRHLTMIHFLVFLLIIALLTRRSLPVGLHVFLSLLLLPGIVITICLIAWIIRAIRVSNTVRRLQKRGDCVDALREIEKFGKTSFERRDVLFGSHYVFFFHYGGIRSYSEIVSLNIKVGKNIPHPMRYMPKRNILWAKTSKKKWLRLACTPTIYQSTNSLETLQNYAAELMKHNSAIKMV